MSGLQKQIDKIKYHIKMLNHTFDYETNPIESLVIELDWDDEDLNKVSDIFEKYDNKLQKSEEINWTAFEMEIRDEFGIGYQTVKSIILAFYRNHQWVDVCKGYANHHDVSEFHEITRS